MMWGNTRHPRVSVALPLATSARYLSAADDDAGETRIIKSEGDPEWQGQNQQPLLTGTVAV